MATMVTTIMTRDPQIVTAEETVADAARRMRDAGTGDVFVMDGDTLVGVVTDRDIAVRIVAEGRDPSTCVREACRDLVVLTPDTTAERAVQIMRERAVDRLPVVEVDLPVGVVGLGDLTGEES